MMALRQTILSQLANLNSQNELMAAATIAIQNRDNVYIPHSQELEGGHPERVGLCVSIGVSPPPNIGKLVKTNLPDKDILKMK